MFPIIALWSHPRSMSTAMERIMRERGDMQCFHEPFMYDYYVNHNNRMMPHFDINEDHPVTYQDVRDMLLKQAAKSPVFLKDMSYYVFPHILSDKKFGKHLTNCFLIRDPIASIQSYFKIDPGMLCEEIGLEAQWRHFDALCEETGDAPVVLNAEDIRRNVKGCVRAFWDAIGLSDIPEAFEWGTKPPEDWQQVGAWHGDVTTSRSIRPLDKAENEAKKKTFAELVKKAPDMQRYLDHHQPFYNRLMEHRIKV